MFNKSIPALVALISLSAFFIIKGVIPAFSQMQTDFPNYYTAGAIARTGIGVERLYDDAWFQEQINANGIEQQGKFSPFPPPTALLFIPFSYLNPLVALQVVTAINICLLVFSIRILSRLFTLSHIESTTFVLLSGWGLANCLRFGQLYLALSLSMLLGYYFFRQNKRVLAGVTAVLLLPIKYFPLVMLPYFVLRREWKTLITACATIGLIFLASILTLGWRIHEDWLFTVLGQHLQSSLSQQDPFSSTFQSFDSLFRRLFVYDARWNTAPLVIAPTLYLVLKLTCVITAIVVAAFALFKMEQRKQSSPLSLSILCLLGLVIAPATATYHFLLLWLPVGILLYHFHSIHAKKHLWLTLVLYSAIGFLPYAFFRQFDGEGMMTLLAYPRLFLMIALFGISIVASVKPARQN